MICTPPSWPSFDYSKIQQDVSPSSTIQIKIPDDPQAEDRFKDIAIAYQTLSDPALRKKYNEFGPKESALRAGMSILKRCLQRYLVERGFCPS